MSRKMVVANWKMHLSLPEALRLTKTLLAHYGMLGNSPRVGLAVPYPYLAQVAEVCSGYSQVQVLAQNIHQEVQGAYTGEVSAAMVASCGARGTLLGHSERRQFFGEDSTLLAQKVRMALNEGLDVVFCVGETLPQRQSGLALQVVEAQLRDALFDLSDHDWAGISLAYEPVWAIGTGQTASPQDAQEMHAHLRRCLAGQYGEVLAAGVSILYGGSVKPGNAAELFAQPDVDGGLVGGASLDAQDFGRIVEALPA